MEARLPPHTVEARLWRLVYGGSYACPYCGGSSMEARIYTSPYCGGLSMEARLPPCTVEARLWRLVCLPVLWRLVYEGSSMEARMPPRTVETRLWTLLV